MKHLFILILACTLSLIALAQPGSRFGVKAGLNSTWLLNSTVNEDPTMDYVPSWGWTAGLSYGYNARMYNIGFTQGIFYRTFSQTLKQSVIGGWEETYDLAYLDLPLLFRVRPAADMASRSYTYGGFYLEIGAQPSLLLSAEKKEGNGNPTVTDIKDQFESFNLFGVFGFGFHQVATEHLAITHGLRLTYGVLNVIAEDADENIVRFKNPAENKPTNAISGGYMLSIAYKFYKGG